MLQSEEDVYRSLAGDGGEPLRRFMNDLIGATAAACGVSGARLTLSSKGNLADGGVDSEVAVPFPGDSTGWFEHPTVWQFKAQDRPPKRAEIADTCTRPLMRARLVAGYALRWVVRSHLPQPAIVECEGLLGEIVRQHNTAAPTPRILGIAQLYQWLQRFPQLSIEMRTHGLSVQAFDTWSRQCRAQLPQYVEIQDWKEHGERLRSHVDLGYTPRSAALRVCGPCGVGKSRLVQDALAGLPGMLHLAIYAPDDVTALALCRRLAAQPDMKAIIVADETPRSVVSQIEDVLSAEKHRLRVVALNSTESTASPECICLTPLNVSDVNSVLAKNFERVSPQRRWHASTLSDGYLRFAAELCRSSDIEITRDSVRGYLERRFANVPDGLDTLCLFALFAKLGWKGDRALQLRVACDAVGLDAGKVRRALTAMKESPGFIALRGRFAFLTPRVVADAAFELGWKKFGLDSDFDGVWAKLDEGLREEMLKHAIHGSESVRLTVTRAIGPHAGAITAAALCDPTQTKRICQLVEMSPSLLLPRVRSVIESASDDELRPILETGGHVLPGSPAQQLVSLCRGLGQFEEWFPDAEAILYRLASASSHPTLEGEAAAAWKQWFGIQLPGTAVTIEHRQQTLAARFASADQRTLLLVTEAVLRVFARNASGPTTDPLVGGRRPPDPWKPVLWDDLFASQERALEILSTRLREDTLQVGVARRAVAASLEGMVHYINMHEAVARFLHAVPWSLADRSVMIQTLEHSLARAQAAAPSSSNPDDYLKWCAGIEHLIRCVQPTDPDSLVKVYFAIPLWQLTPRRKHQDVNPTALASVKSVAQSELSPDLLAWMFGSEPQSSQLFGELLAAEDPDHLRLPSLYRAARTGTDLGTLVGYLRKLGTLCPDVARRQGASIAELATFNAMAAFGAYQTLGDLVDGFERAIDLVRSGRMPVANLYSFSVWIGDRRAGVIELRTILAELTKATRLPESNAAANALVEILTWTVHDNHLRSVIDSPEGQAAAWEFIGLLDRERGPHAARTDPDVILAIVEALVRVDPDRLASCLRVLLAHFDMLADDTGSPSIAATVRGSPAAAAEVLWDVLLNDDVAARIGTLAPALLQLPVELVSQALEQRGDRLAVKLSWHLPGPYRDDKGLLLLPKITRYCLNRYWDSEDFRRRSTTHVHVGGASYFGGDDSLNAVKLYRDLVASETGNVRSWAQRMLERLERLTRNDDLGRGLEDEDEFFLP